MLPPELRNPIYRYYVANHHTVVPAKKFRITGYKSTPPILLVNKQLYLETKPLLCDLPTEITCFNYMPDVITIFTIPGLQRLQEVTLYISLNFILDERLSSNIFDSPMALLAFWIEQHRLRKLTIDFTDGDYVLRHLTRSIYNARTFLSELRRLRGIEDVCLRGVWLLHPVLLEVKEKMQLPKGDEGGKSESSWIEQSERQEYDRQEYLESLEVRQTVISYVSERTD
ncbi:MAG: hypothetical protein M1812_007756 [Candelaria pacifica]|nr:MAG: hypothetical protein M1812_007756 [Candelaria pacifica]